MTVTYTHKVANARLGGFSRLLCRWKGSVYKLFYKEFLIYISCYTAVSLLYRLVLTGGHKAYFEKLCLQFGHYTDLVPISFVLGFYVSIVVGRWWSQYENLPFPDSMMIMLGSCLHGTDVRGRLLRRTLLRYLNLAQVLTYRCVSTAVYKRFPTLQHVVAAGLMTPNELGEYENVKSVNLKYWVPIMWFSNLLTKARQEGRIYDDMTFKLLMEALNSFRLCCGWLVSYDWISIPLVYTQVVTVAVYMFFMSTLLSRQYLDVTLDYPGHEVDLYVPIFTIGQFFFYMGWLKVAEQLINPFGEDDDDFEVNWCIDRNMEVSMVAADQMYGKHPKLEKDKFWSMEKLDIPYTAAAANHKVEPFMGSTYDMRVSKDDTRFPRDINGNVKMAVLSENSDELSKEKKDWKHSGKGAKLLRSASFALSSVSSVRLNSRSSRHWGKYEMVDREDRHSSSDGDSDSSSSPPRSPIHQWEGSRCSEERDSDDESVVSLTAANKGDDVANNGSDEKEDHEDDKNVFELSLVSDESVNLLARFKKKPDANQPGEDEKSDKPLQLLVHPKKSPKKRPADLMVLPEKLHNQQESFFLAPVKDDSDDDRKNAERRVHLSARKRRARNSLLNRRKRPYKDSYLPQLWIQQQRRRLRRESFSARSPEANSLHSETDIGSGPNADSPFGSSVSFSTSIPSPRPLRWAFKSKRRNIYADDGSVISSLHSPSGNEGETTDAQTPVNSSSTLFGRLETTAIRSNREGSVVIAISPQSSNQLARDVPTPFTDDLRKRLQVIPNTNQLLSTLPLLNLEKNSTQDDVRPSDAAKHSGSNFASKVHRFGSQSPVEKAKKNMSESSALYFKLSGRKREKPNDANESLPLAFRKRNDSKQDELLAQEPLAGIPKPPRGAGALLSALKTWNAKRKETRTRQKESKQQTSFRTTVSEGDVTKLIKIKDVESCHTEPGNHANASIEFNPATSKSRSDDWTHVIANAGDPNGAYVSKLPFCWQRSEEVDPAPGASPNSDFRAPDLESNPPQFGGSVQWENECWLDSASKRARTTQPISEQVDKALNNRVTDDNGGGSVHLLEVSSQDVDPLKRLVARNGPRLIENSENDSLILEKTEFRSDSCSHVAAVVADQSDCFDTFDEVADDKVSKNAPNSMMSSCSGEIETETPPVSVPNGFSLDEDKRCETSFDEGYLSAPYIASETCGPRSGASGVCVLDAIPENSCIDDVNSICDVSALLDGSTAPANGKKIEDSEKVHVTFSATCNIEGEHHEDL